MLGMEGGGGGGETGGLTVPARLSARIVRHAPWERVGGSTGNMISGCV